MRRPLIRPYVMRRQPSSGMRSNRDMKTAITSTAKVAYLVMCVLLILCLILGLYSPLDVKHVRADGTAYVARVEARGVTSGPTLPVKNPTSAMSGCPPSSFMTNAATSARKRA